MPVKPSKTSNDRHCIEVWNYSFKAWGYRPLLDDTSAVLSGQKASIRDIHVCKTKKYSNNDYQAVDYILKKISYKQVTGFTVEQFM